MNWKDHIVEWIDYLVNGIVLAIFLYAIVLAFGFLGAFWQ